MSTTSNLNGQSKAMDNIKIAGSLTIKDWYELKCRLDPQKNELWQLAFSFFEQRIQTRYLTPIKAILGMNLNTGEGFAVVNLQCSLIETIECFYKGWIYQYPDFIEMDGSKFQGNVKVFENFFKSRSPFKEVVILREEFYKNVRCGLLHETQTKEGWVIRDKHDSLFYELKEKKKIIYRTNFQTAIEKVIDGYKEEILGGDATLRENFIAKMDHICNES